MTRRHMCFGVQGLTARIAMAAVLTIPIVAQAQGQAAFPPPVKVGGGIGAGYAVAPGFWGEPVGGDWSGKAFVTLAFRGLPVELRPTFFSYGRGTGEQLSGGICLFPGPSSCSLPSYWSGYGPERVTGGSLDAVIRLRGGPVVPYLVGGPGLVSVTRKSMYNTTVHGVGFGYSGGVGARLVIGPVSLFSEGQFFTTDASARQFYGHHTHMIPITAGVAF